GDLLHVFGAPPGGEHRPHEGGGEAERHQREDHRDDDERDVRTAEGRPAALRGQGYRGPGHQCPPVTNSARAADETARRIPGFSGDDNWVPRTRDREQYVITGYCIGRPWCRSHPVPAVSW